MEALAAVSLVGNILQFVDTTKTLISSSRQIRNLGAREEHVELETLTRELQNLIERVTPPETPVGTLLSDEEKSLQVLRIQSSRTARQLLDMLQGLKLKEGAGRLDSFYQALRSEWEQDNIDGLKSRLDRLGRAINMHLTAYDHRRILDRLDELAVGNRRLEAHRTQEIKDLKKQFKDLFDELGREVHERNQITGLLIGATAKGLQYSTEQIVLEQLRFSAIDTRYAAIQEPYQQTLEWVFGKPEQASPATFEHWLSSEDDLYWISGKPGSGKSTMMKFLLSHPHTIASLNIWAGGHPIIKAEHFFWNAGNSAIHKSQQGLLRSLVYKILRERPELISQVYPEASSASTAGLASKLEIPLTTEALQHALQKISFYLIGSEARFCFFIDGLDEYHGNPYDIIEIVAHLRTLPNVKLCVSSRPWNEFEQAFGKDGAKKLYMQDFNRNDISAYIYDIFARDENYQDLEEKDTQGEALIQEIINAANGVFLWVFLVSKSFQEGLLNGDRIVDLRARLRSLPTDLDDYYRRILTIDVGEFYRTQSAVIFSVTLEAASSLSLIAYWFLGEEDPDYVFNLEYKALTLQQIDKRLRDMRKRLNACCKGLLEIQDTVGDAESSPSTDIYFTQKVNFLHRTVRDFLKRADTSTLLRSWLPPNFIAHEAISKALIAQLKAAPQSKSYFHSYGPGTMVQTIARIHVDAIPTCNDSVTDYDRLHREFEDVVRWQGLHPVWERLIISKRMESHHTTEGSGTPSPIPEAQFPSRKKEDRPAASMVEEAATSTGNGVLFKRRLKTSVYKLFSR